MSSLVVAEQFGMLEALHPGRIDLGIGRAPGTDQVTAAALRRSPEALSADDFPDQLMDLLGFFTGRWPEGHPFAQITAMPGRGNQPGHVAARLERLQRPGGRRCSASRSPSRTTSARPTRCPRWPCTASTSARRRSSTRPYAMVAAAVVCAETDERARWLAGSGALSFLRLRSGRPGPLPSPGGGGRLPLHRPGTRVRRGPPGLADRRLAGDRPARASPTCSRRPPPTS